jgi:pimeloyl-ACP methyl ester carboxylesterase
MTIALLFRRTRLIRANFAVIPGAGHAPQLDNMTEFIRVIRQFLIGPSDK